MPPKKQLKTTNESEDSKNMVCTDDKVQLLLETLINIKSEKSYEGIAWESIKERYEIIRKEFLAAFPSEANKEFSHGKSFFTRERISSKVKQIRVKYRKALDIGRQSSGGIVVATFYDLCSQIQSGSPATESISGGIETVKNNASTNSSHTTEDTSFTNSEEKQELDDGSDESDEDREQEDEVEGTNHKNKDDGVTGNTAKAISSGKEKSSRDKMREMLDKRRNKK